MIDIKIVDNKMTITIDIDDNSFVVSKSGKTKVITTGGFKPVEGTDCKVSLNIIKPKG